jgi:hypothetical protein
MLKNVQRSTDVMNQRHLLETLENILDYHLLKWANTDSFQITEMFFFPWRPYII